MGRNREITLAEGADLWARRLFDRHGRGGLAIIAEAERRDGLSPEAALALRRTRVQLLRLLAQQDRARLRLEQGPLLRRLGVLIFFRSRRL